VLFKANNFFEIFSLPASYQVDLAELDAGYRQLQAQVHPDRFAGGSEQDKLQAIKATSLLNEAYSTLKSPQKRAAYLLSLAGIDVEQVDQADLSPALLMEQIELREQLEELPRDEAALGQLEQLRSGISERRETSQQQFATALESGQLSQAKKSYYEMQYFAKLAMEIDSLEEDLLGY
jgi:molecular chaperone HscB